VLTERDAKMNLPSLTVILIAIRISFCYYPRDYTADKRDQGPYKLLQWTQEWFSCCAIDNCTSYRGTVNTPQGKGLHACYDWTDKMKQKYPDAGLESNYCRNPGGSKFAPWCFVRTDDSKDRNWRYCRVCSKAYRRPPNAANQGSELTINYGASSIWSGLYAADKAVKGGKNYWCSAENGGSPQFWWISFVEKPVEIVSIVFEEKYPGAEFEFFASETKECGNDGRKLINGTREMINDKKFVNGKAYHCYGLKITNLPNTKYGGLASLRNLEVRGKSLTFGCLKRGQLCSLDTGSENGGCCPVHHTRSKEFRRRGQFYLTDFRNMTCKKNKHDSATRCETDCVEKGENNPDIQRFPRREYCCWGLDRRYRYKNCL